MTKRIEKAIEVLQMAYLHGTLKAGDCTACAVGNLVAASSYEGSAHDWSHVFYTYDGTQEFYDPRDVICSAHYGLGLEAIEATGYSVAELARIEFAFETALSKEDEGTMPEHQSQWIRLQAVLEVLFEIEGIEYNQEVEKPFLEKALS